MVEVDERRGEMMKVAVMTLTRDRLAYTRHCFELLHEHAGIEFDHFIVDQGSEDGTAEWLQGQDAVVEDLARNIGVCPALNLILDEMLNPEDYDVIVKFDNDCELIQPNTLRDVCELVLLGGAILSPRILGLQSTPAPMRMLKIGHEEILDIPQIGGIFLAAPAWVFDENVAHFRYSEDNPLYGLDDVEICRWWRSAGGTCGYVNRLEAWHYLSTDGQRADDPGYFVRKDAEYEAA